MKSGSNEHIHIHNLLKLLVWTGMLSRTILKLLLMQYSSLVVTIIENFPHFAIFFDIKFFPHLVMFTFLKRTILCWKKGNAKPADEATHIVITMSGYLFKQNMKFNEK